MNGYEPVDLKTDFRAWDFVTCARNFVFLLKQADFGINFISLCIVQKKRTWYTAKVIVLYPNGVMGMQGGNYDSGTKYRKTIRSITGRCTAPGSGRSRRKLWREHKNGTNPADVSQGFSMRL